MDRFGLKLFLFTHLAMNSYFLSDAAGAFRYEFYEWLSLSQNYCIFSKCENFYFQRNDMFYEVTKTSSLGQLLKRGSVIIFTHKTKENLTRITFSYFYVNSRNFLMASSSGFVIPVLVLLLSLDKCFVRVTRTNLIL